MEGARLRCSVALPRVVDKPTVIEDNGDKVMLKAGQEIICNMVRLLHHFLSFLYECSSLTELQILGSCRKRPCRIPRPRQSPS
jgi:hypothetical protein